MSAEIPKKERAQAALLLADGTALIALDRRKRKRVAKVADHREPVAVRVDEPLDLKYGGVNGSQLGLRTYGGPLDMAVYPPAVRGGDECASIQRPCNRYACEFHLWPQDERPGRPHSPGARPPVHLKVMQQSCMYDVIRAGDPDGLTADEVGRHFGVVGERILQVENRALLKRQAIEAIRGVVEALRGEFAGQAVIASFTPHNERRLPNNHFVTIRVESHAPVPLRHAVGRLVIELVDLSIKLPRGQELADLMISKEGAATGARAADVTVAIRVREQTSKSPSKNSGVVVRRPAT